MSETKISLKLLIDSKSERVLFAEADKEFVDFLFTLLSLPVGSLIRLLSSDGMVGTLGKLYDSFKDLNDTYIQPHVNKDALLKPASSLGDSSSSPTILSITNDTSSSNNPKRLYVCNNCRRYGSDGASAICPGCQNSMSTNLNYVAPPKTLYVCNNCRSYGSDGASASCPSCNYSMSSNLNYVAPPQGSLGSSSEGGFVKGVVTYMVMDDLEVKPMSTISSLTMLNSVNLKDIGALQEKTVSVGMDEGLKLLKSSLETKSVLTKVFLGKAAGKSPVKRAVKQIIN